MSSPASRARAAAPELPVGEPLAEQRKLDVVVALRRLLGERLGVGVAQFLRPAAPVFAVALAVDRVEHGEAEQAVAALGDEGVEVGEQAVLRPRRAGAQEGGEAVLQRRALDAPHRLVVDRPTASTTAASGSPSAAGRRRPVARPPAGRRRRARRSGSGRGSAGRRGDRGSRGCGRAGNSACIGLTPK